MKLDNSRYSCQFKSMGLFPLRRPGSIGFHPKAIIKSILVLLGCYRLVPDQFVSHAIRILGLRHE